MKMFKVKYKHNSQHVLNSNIKIIFVSVFLIPSVLFLAGCISSNDWATKIEWDNMDFLSLPEKADFQDAPAVMLLNDGKIEIFALSENRFSVLDRHQVIKIFDPRGYKYANVMIPYGSQSTVESIEARTISPSGEITVLKPDKIYDVNLYPDFVFYSDQRAKIFTLPSIEDGCIIEYRYTLNIHSSTYGNLWRFQHDIPVSLSRFKLLKPAEWDVDYRLYEIELEPEKVEAPAGFKSSLLWEVRDLPGLKHEIAMPPAAETGARLRLSPVAMRSWSDISQWYYSLLHPQLENRGDLNLIVDEIIGDLENDADQLRILFEWTRDRVRYISVSIGVGGYQPNPVIDIIRNKYGDCKDMTTLICALAEEAGLEVYPALISTRNHGIPDTSLPSISQFNHIIAYCPDLGENGIWLDATDKTCPFGQLPWYDQGLPVLMVKPDNTGEIIYTPKSQAENNISKLNWEVEIDSAGGAFITGKTVYWGAVANEVRQNLYYSLKNEHRQWLEFYLANRCSGAILDTFNIKGVNPVNDSLLIEYAFITPSFAQEYQKALSFQPAKLAAFDLPDYFRSADRSHPIHFQFPSKSILDLQIKLPEGWIVENGVVKDSLHSKFGYASWNFQTHTNIFYSTCTYLMNSEIIEPGEYVIFQDFLDTIRKKDLYQVFLKRSK